MIRRAPLNLWFDLAALGAGAVAFSTGLILLTQFHMGHGALRAGRAEWADVHRLAAAVAAAGVAGHIYLHRTVITTRVARWLRGLPGKASRADVALYLLFPFTTLCAFGAWLVLSGTPHTRHHAVDLHHLSSLALLPAAIIHVGRHAAWLWRQVRSRPWK
jgi:hypothetical protein